MYCVDKVILIIKIKNFLSYLDEDMVLTGTGNYGDEEAILRWRREKNSVSLVLNGLIYSSQQKILYIVIWSKKFIRFIF